MEQQFSTSKVRVEYFDPHDVYKLLSPGLSPRLPLHNLHWQSHAGPLRSIDTLHVDLVQGGDGPVAATPTPSLHRSDSTSRDDGFQTQNMGGRAGSTETVDAQSLPVKPAGAQRRHQIPGLRRTPYLKILFVRCDDNDSYKSTVRTEVREWIKAQAPHNSSSKKGSKEEKHDAFEWLVVHVVIPNTAASTQPRSSGTKSDSAAQDKSSTSRWRSGSTPLLEKFRSDFNSTSKGAPDRIAQIRIGINDVPYDMLPRVVPAVPSGYAEGEQDALNAWNELVGKLTSLILSSFDMRVTQYEEDIKEKDGQRTLPGWNFCTFFILKEGLARGFENVGLVEDALVGYDELSVGLDSVIHEQAEMGSPESHGGAMLNYTEELKQIAGKVLSQASGADGEDEEAVDLQSKETTKDHFDEIPISSTKKAYRDMILANKVSVFDFRCYIFSRQISLLLRLGNASITREELLEKLKYQEESNLQGVSPVAAPTKHEDESENLAMLAEVCRRTLQFVPSVSHTMRQDIIAAIQSQSGVKEDTAARLDPLLEETVENIVATFAFSVAQQILAQTSTKALPIPPSSVSSGDGQEPKSSIPEPKTMMHPARTSSLYGQPSPRPPPSPGAFPGPGRRASVAGTEVQSNHFLKAGIEQLAAKRAELYMLSRSILDGLGKKREWSTGWAEAPMMGDTGVDGMEEVNLDDDTALSPAEEQGSRRDASGASVAGVDSHLLWMAMDNIDDFYRLYEILTDKALRHYTVANHDHAVQANMADLAVLKVHMKEYREAARYFFKTTPFFGEEGWSLLELSMLVMYAKCLDELQSKEEYVTIALTLLTKACAAEKERLEAKSSLRFGKGKKAVPDLSPLQGVVGKLFSLAAGLSSEVKVLLANFFTNVDIAGTPEYYDKRDGCSISINLRSLLPEEVTINGVELKVSCPDGGPRKNLVFEKKGDIVLTPGKNVIRVDCNSAVPGTYSVSYFALLSTNMCLRFERDGNHPTPASTDIFKSPDVTLFQRTGALDVLLRASKHTTLDKDNSLDLELSTGWNDLKSCDIRIKPSTGGLRLLTTKSEIVDSSGEFAKPPETGAFFFGSIDAGKSVTMRFPYSVEQDVGDVSAKVEVTYVTTSGETFYLAKSLAVSVYLALGVSVQDVFKHQSLFSRFNVSSVTQSPLRLYKSELFESDYFESAFGVPPANTVLVFPKQPASLVYKVRRKDGSKATKKPGKVMHLKLHYSLLQTEVEDVIAGSVAAALKKTQLAQYSKLILACVAGEVKSALHAQDLERTALLGEVATSFLEDVSWARHFRGFGTVPGTDIDVATKASEILVDWQQSHRRIPMPMPSASEQSSILIPVEIPSISIVHTADIRLDKPIHSPVEGREGGAPTVSVNQMLPATLHLKWTRMWDTETAQGEDQEFSYEVTAPVDTWLLGGRRKGHFVIPGSLETAASTPETEAEIPVILVPLREGFVPYPMVEIREVKSDPGASMDRRDSVDADDSGSHACEVDWRNLGETVRVVGERSGVTLSLDASGPGGGPLVFEKESLGRHQGRMVA